MPHCEAWWSLPGQSIERQRSLTCLTGHFHLCKRRPALLEVVASGTGSPRVCPVSWPWSSNENSNYSPSYSTESSPAYYEFVGVRSCEDVVHLYRLLWVSTVLNVLGLCLGIVTAAVLGAFKDMVSDGFLCISSRPALAQTSPSGKLSGSLNKGGSKLPSPPAR